MIEVDLEKGPFRPIFHLQKSNGSLILDNLTPSRLSDWQLGHFIIEASFEKFSPARRFYKKFLAFTNIRRTEGTEEQMGAWLQINNRHLSTLYHLSNHGDYEKW